MARPLAAQRDWVIDGEPEWQTWEKSWPGVWYGVKRFFKWLETKSYKMHIRVLLSKYRAYTPCGACEGARLKPDALLWRLGTRDDATGAIGQYKRFRPLGTALSDAALDALPGLTVHDLMLLPLDRVRTFFDDAAPARAARRGHRPAAGRDPRAARLSQRRGARLSHPRSPVAHALRRRSPAHQPHHRARHVAGEYALRARRAVDRPASARHGPRHRRDEAPARRRQFAGGGRARSADHVRRRSPARHRPRSGRARRRDRLLRSAGSDAHREHAHRRISLRTRAAPARPGRRARSAPAAKAAGSNSSAPPSTTSRASTWCSRCGVWSA